MAPYILESLHRAGMKKDQIRFIWALGAHGVYDMINAREQLENEIWVTSAERSSSSSSKKSRIKEVADISSYIGGDK